MVKICLREQKTLKLKISSKASDLAATGIAGTICIFLLIVLAALIMAIPAGILFIGWNWGVSPAFHAPSVTFWQMYGIAWVLSIVGQAFRSSGSKSD
jgi:hypothetical protein